MTSNADLMPMFLQDCILDALLLLERKLVRVDHRVEREVADVLEGVCGHVKADGAVEDHASELEQRVEREGGDVRLGPPVATFLNIFLEFDPPQNVQKISAMVVVSVLVFYSHALEFESR